eukprot:364241-Chlamydomonas_euryale.AAC.5
MAALRAGRASCSSSLVASSPAEAEYQVMAAGVSEALLPGMVLHCDHTAVKMLSEDQSRVKRCKHVDVVQHFAVNRATRGEVIFKYVKTADNLADVFTKPLGRHKLSSGLCWDCLALQFDKAGRESRSSEASLWLVILIGWNAFPALLYASLVAQGAGSVANGGAGISQHRQRLAGSKLDDRLQHVSLPCIVPCMTEVTGGSVGISSGCCPSESLPGACKADHQGGTSGVAA